MKMKVPLMSWFSSPPNMLEIVSKTTLKVYIHSLKLLFLARKKGNIKHSGMSTVCVGIMMLQRCVIKSLEFCFVKIFSG